MFMLRFALTKPADFDSLPHPLLLAECMLPCPPLHLANAEAGGDYAQHEPFFSLYVGPETCLPFLSNDRYAEDPAGALVGAEL